MPDKPTYSKREHPGKRTLETAHTPAREPRRRAYAELQCHTNFSLLLGASHPEELVERAAALGYEAIAITDRHTLAGVVRMHCAAKTHGIKLIVGVELIPADARPVLLYAINRVGYGNLCRIITNGRLRSKKGECRVTFDDIATHHEGLLAAIPIPGGKQDQGNKAKGSRDQGIEGRRDGGSEPRPSGSGTKEERDEAVGGMVHAQRDHDQTHTPGRDTDREGSTAPGIERYRRLFGKRLYLIAGVHAGTDDALTLARAGALSRQTHVPLIATNDVHYHRPERRFLQDVLTCIRLHRTLSDAGKHLFANAERHLKPIDELAALFSDLPDAVTRTTELADRCTFSLDELRYEYPEALCPPDRTPHDFLTELTWHGADKHYPDGIPDKVRDLIKHELNLISELAYEPYFLTVWDIVTYARSRDILCQGRGSAANSVVCYCLGITSVDPDRIDLLFERFVSAERNEPPDIDVDFEHERREEVFQYIYEKYGREFPCCLFG